MINNFFYFPSVIPEKICDDIVRTAKFYNNFQLAKTGKFSFKNLKKKDVENLKKTRNSNICWLNDSWIYDLTKPFLDEANSKLFKFEYDYIEQIQFTEYGIDQHYDWHKDSWEEPYKNNSNLNYNGKIRKISLSLILSDINNYVGGDFQFDYKIKKQKIITCSGEMKKKGSILIFPSYVYHRVTPIISGTRHSLVMWALGKPFK